MCSCSTKLAICPFLVAGQRVIGSFVPSAVAREAIDRYVISLDHEDGGPDIVLLARDKRKSVCTVLPGDRQVDMLGFGLIPVPADGPRCVTVFGGKLTNAE